MVDSYGVRVGGRCISSMLGRGVAKVPAPPAGVKMFLKFVGGVGFYTKINLRFFHLDVDQSQGSGYLRSMDINPAAAQDALAPVDHSDLTFCVVAATPERQRFVYATAQTLGAVKRIARGLRERGTPNKRGYLIPVTDVKVTWVKTAGFRAADYYMTSTELAAALS